MKRILSIGLFVALISPTSLLPYYAEKKGLKVLVTDYARTPEALCIEVDVSDAVVSSVGKGIPAKNLLNMGLRPVGVAVTNTSDKPMMLAPFYGTRTSNLLANYWVQSMCPSSYIAWTVMAGVTAYAGAALGVIALAMHRHDRAIPLILAWILAGGFVGSCFMAYQSGSAFSEFSKAIHQKFDELNFKDEALILPGQTVHKLLLCSKDEYISRFPLVIYPLEKREDMIVFDVDLRA